MNMKNHRRTSFVRRSTILVIASGAVWSPAQAQSPGQVLQGFLNAARQGGQPGTPPIPTGRIAEQQAAMTQGSQPMPQNLPMFWTTKKEFLDSARQGVFMKLPQADVGTRIKVVNSVLHILVTDYGIQSISKDCYDAGGFKRDVLGLLDGVVKLSNLAMGTQPPDFYSNADLGPGKQEMKDFVARMRDPANRTLCDNAAMGQVVPAPYKEALLSFIREYEQANYEFFQAERGRRVAAYQRDQAQQQQQDAANHAAAAQAQAASRAAEQQQIDAENARIKADEAHRAQVDKARVGG